MQQISSGQPPQVRDLPRFSPLTKAVLQKAAIFCKYELSLADKKHRGAGAPSVIYGTEAVQYRFAALENMAKQSDQMDLGELRLVKQFRWLLEDAQKLTFAKWLRLVVPVHVGFAPALTMGKDEAPTESAGGNSSQGAMVASTSAPSSGAPAKKKSKHAVALVACDKQALMNRFFPEVGGRATEVLARVHGASEMSHARWKP